MAVPCPDAGADERFRRWHGRLERLVGTPGAVRAMMEWNWAIDIRPLLATIAVPTLVLHRAKEVWIEPGCGRYLADHIPGSRFVEIQGRDHYPYLEPIEPTLEEIERFLTGARHEPVAERVLTTVLFTDVVRSARDLRRSRTSDPLRSRGRRRGRRPGSGAARGNPYGRMRAPRR